MSKTGLDITQSFEIAWESDSKLWNDFSISFYAISISMNLYNLGLFVTPFMNLWGQTGDFPFPDFPSSNVLKQ